MTLEFVTNIYSLFVLGSSLPVCTKCVQGVCLRSYCLSKVFGVIVFDSMVSMDVFKFKLQFNVGTQCINAGLDAIYFSY